jgi:hypothetical protein
MTAMAPVNCLIPLAHEELIQAQYGRAALLRRLGKAERQLGPTEQGVPMSLSFAIFIALNDTLELPL